MRPILYGIWLLVVLAVYLLVPYLAWHHVPYSGFWQTFAMVVITGIYEYFAVIFGLFIFGGSLAAIAGVNTK